jgi:oligopeptide/dipeptide ABC transporter ATP-binding protein
MSKLKTTRFTIDVAVGKTEALFRAPKHPYTQALLAAVPRLKSAKSREIVDLGTTFPNPVDLPPGCTFHPRCRFAGDICRTVAPATVATTTGAVECHMVSQPEKFHMPGAAVQ